MDNRNEPAMPQFDEGWEDSRDGRFHYNTEGGLTKLEYAAIHIAAGMVAFGSRVADKEYVPDEMVPAASAAIAKALFDELEKSK